MSRTAGSCQAFELALASLGASASLQAEDVDRLRPLCRQVEAWPAGSLVEAPRRRDRVRLITSGWMYEARLLPDGRCQIFGYLLPGDLISSRHARRASPNILLALTRVETVEVPAVKAAAPDDRAGFVWEGLARSIERQEERSYEALLRVGKYTALQRVAHLLLEFRDRLMPVGLATQESFRAPLTQEHLADTLGLSVIHVSRVLKQLRDSGVLTMAFGVVTVLDPDALRQLAAGAAPQRGAESGH